MQSKLFVTFVSIFVIFGLYYTVHAYTLIQSLPGFSMSEGGDLLGTYLTWLFRFALVVTAFLAVTQITIGGIQMMIGGASETARSDAKSRISDAIWGLLLALAAWLILSLINGSLLNMTLVLPNVNIEATAVPTGGGGGCGACGGTCNGFCPSGQTCDQTGSGYVCHGATTEDVVWPEGTRCPTAPCSSGQECVTIAGNMTCRAITSDTTGSDTSGTTGDTGSDGYDNDPCGSTCLYPQMCVPIVDNFGGFQYYCQ